MDSLKKAHQNHPRHYSDFIYAYPVISRRSGGVSIGVNLNPDKNCNFDCPYCQVDRTHLPENKPIEIDILLEEVRALLESFDEDGVSTLPQFSSISPEMKKLRDVALSGDGEPTMVSEFPQICKALADLQEAWPQPFKLVLITNGTLLAKKNVQEGASYLRRKNGSLWVKLDAGTEEYYQKVNVSKVPLLKIVEGMMDIGKHHPLTIQTLFLKMHGVGPSENEIEAYIQNICQVKNSGVAIEEVQLHTVARQPSQSFCSALEEGILEKMGQQIGEKTGAKVLVYS